MMDVRHFNIQNRPVFPAFEQRKRSERPGRREPSHFDKSQCDGRERRQLASFVWINCSPIINIQKSISPPLQLHLLPPAVYKQLRQASPATAQSSFQRAIHHLHPAATRHPPRSTHRASFPALYEPLCYYHHVVFVLSSIFIYLFIFENIHFPS